MSVLRIMMGIYCARFDSLDEGWSKVVLVGLQSKIESLSLQILKWGKVWNIDKQMNIRNFIGILPGSFQNQQVVLCGLIERVLSIWWTCAMANGTWPFSLRWCQFAGTRAVTHSYGSLRCTVWIHYAQPHWYTLYPFFLFNLHGRDFEAGLHAESFVVAWGSTSLGKQTWVWIVCPCATNSTISFGST